ncbi:MAG: hypothetical protein R3264_16860, partial [Anaerolineae bacterium]|nr:hypothetical protein [Anaerolineae bacterium]
PLLQRTTQLVAEQLAPLGIKFNVDAQDPATIRQIRVSQAAGIPEYDAHVGPLESHTHADPDGLYYFFHSPGPQQGVGGIFTGYKNPEFDALVEQASLTFDREERRALLYQAQEILAAEVPAIVYFYPDGNFAYRIEAYDGWLSDPGHGIFTKRSFLPGYATGR